MQVNHKSGNLNIGLTYYQERQWISAINKYGNSILNKSLLSNAQKDILISTCMNEKMERSLQCKS